MSSCHSRTHNLGKVRGTKVMESFGLSNAYCNLGPLGADMVMVDGQSHHLQRHPLQGNLLDGQTSRVVGLADLYVAVLAPLPSLSNPLWLGQWLVKLLGLSWGQWQGRLIFLPMYLLL